MFFANFHTPIVDAKIFALALCTLRMEYYESLQTNPKATIVVVVVYGTDIIVFIFMPTAPVSISMFIFICNQTNY